MRQILRRFIGAGLAALGLVFWSGCEYFETCFTSSCGADCSHHDHGHDGHDHEPSSEASDDHSHTHIGPNGGRLIVLGDEDYHAELIIDHDRAEAIVCILDRTGRKPVGIDQREITLNLRCAGLPHQIQLQAVEPNDGDPIRSCFRGMSEILRGECEVAGRLNVIIQGKPYTGQVAHRVDDHKVIR